MAPTHGPLHDEFPAQARDPHGAQQDEGYGSSTAQSGKHGAKYDDFDRHPTAQTGKHGTLFDEFDWKVVPPQHGQNFDTDFAQPAMLDGVDHGNWYDVFRGGRVEVKYIFGGKDYEGTVQHTGQGFVTVQSYGRNQGGDRHDISLGQIKELRRFTKLGGPDEDRHPTATPGNTPAPFTPSSAEAPSAHDAKARGGGARKPVRPSESKVANKTVDDTVADLRKTAAALDVDVAKSEATYKATCTNCGRRDTYVGAHKGAAAAHHWCTGCSGSHPVKHVTPAVERFTAPTAHKTTVDDAVLDLRKQAAELEA